MTTSATVEALFQRILQRDASVSEAASFVAVIDSGALTLTQARDAIVQSSEATSFVDPAIRIYQAAFGRVPDQAGLDVNVDFLRAGGSIQDLANAFVASPEFTARFGGTTVSTAFLEALYQNVLGRSSDPQGLAGFLSSGLTAGQILVAFSESVEFKANTDAAVTTFLEQAGDGDPVFTGGPLGGGIIGTPGSTFTFTTAPDALIGTTNNDTFNGVVDGTTPANNTFSILDSVDGGVGSADVLNIIDVDGNALPGATIAGIETLNVRALGAGSSVDVNGLPGVTTINSTRSTNDLGINNATNTTTVGLISDGLVATQDLDVDYVAGATSATINIDGGVKNTSDVDIDGTGLTSVTVNSTGAANVLTNLDLNGTTATTVSIHATTAIDTNGVSVGNNAADQNLFVIGVAADIAATATERAKSAVNLGALDADFATVDASGQTGGGISATVGSVTQKITGGAGADQITTNGVLTTGSVDSGAGANDLLIISASADVATGTLGGKYTNFEALQVENAQTVDLDNIAGITSILLNDGAGATAVTDLSAAQAGAITQLATNGAVTIGVKGATTVGQIDTVSITASDGDTTTSENIGGAALPTLLGVENLIINAVDDAAFTLSAATTPNLNSITLIGAGDHTLITGNVATANTTINGSAATGKVSVDASGFLTNGVSITGGTGADTLTGSGQVDVLSGGAGADTLDGGGTAAVAAVAEVFTATFAGTEIGGDTTITFDGLAAITLLANVGGIAIAADFTGKYNADGARTYNAVANGDGTVTFTSIAVGARADVVTGDFVINDVGGNDGVAVTTTAAAPTTQGVTAAASAFTTDTLTGGADADTFVIGTAGASTAAVADNVTDFVTKSDKIDFAALATAGTAANFSEGGAAVADFAAALVAANTALNGVILYSAQQVGADTFVFADVDGNGSAADAVDGLVKLTGVGLDGIEFGDIVA